MGIYKSSFNNNKSALLYNCLTPYTTGIELHVQLCPLPNTIMIEEYESENKILKDKKDRW